MVSYKDDFYSTSYKVILCVCNIKYMTPVNNCCILLILFVYYTVVWCLSHQHNDSINLLKIVYCVGICIIHCIVVAYIILRNI